MIGTLLLDAQGKTCYHGPETGDPSGFGAFDTRLVPQPTMRREERWLNQD